MLLWHWKANRESKREGATQMGSKWVLGVQCWNRPTHTPHAFCCTPLGALGEIFRPIRGQGTHSSVLRYANWVQLFLLPRSAACSGSGAL